MENEEQSAETFAEVLAELMAEYNASGSDIARAIDGSPSTVSTWLHGKRTPRNDAIRKIADRYPKYSVKRLTDAVGRKAPAPLTPDRRERVLDIFDQLTEEQQEMMLITGKALADSNREQS
ncbi:helix-turn-helix domain-containing protein [Streptomyces albicerus]|uniref:helix-turn-helix domain-containing protein n=1 Tax=Streptomyces albicerus TaxID=2569859 RepID=UPI00124B4EFB|nr:helix-turn-helix transcriptional regulator [Streptomyces albicerus]